MKKINKARYAGLITGVSAALIVCGVGLYVNISGADKSYAKTKETRIANENIVEEIDFSVYTEVPDNTEISEEYVPLYAGIEQNFAAANSLDEEVAVALYEEDLQTSETDEVSKQEQEIEEPQTYWGYKNLGIAHVDNHLNVREEASETGKLIGKLPKDAACEILEIDDNGWAHIKSGKVDGYCSTEYLYMGNDAIERGKQVASMIAVVNTQTLKVREEPNTDSIVITLIPEEEELEVIEIMENGWIKFLLDDEEAYVSGDFVDVEERLEKAVTLTELKYGEGVSDVRVDLVQYAKTFIGNPYVWGGTSLTNGADCSGFTLSIYKKYGVSLPHHAASQAKMGKAVTLAEAQPGDLVFYSKNGSINHVAIYIGGGQVVHASSPKTGIKISSVSYRSISCIRRFLP
ncbi:MAG: NlpC/P60 family protein [Lachnospiraceae bacterium]|nr:NlpC/P60 family protein [Lachnospiraceae bacterium]